MSQSDALRGSGDQARQVSYDKTVAGRGAYHPQMSMKCRKRIVCDTCHGIGNLVDQGRFASNWHTQQDDISQYLELEAKFFSGPFFATGKLSGSAVGAAFKVEVAHPASPSLGQQDLLAILSQIKQQGVTFLIVDAGAHWHAQQQILACSAKLVAAPAIFTIFGLIDARITEINEGIDIAIGHSVNGATPATVPAIRPAFGDKALAPEAGDPVAAVSSDHLYGCFINKFHGLDSKKKRIAGEASPPLL